MNIKQLLTSKGFTLIEILIVITIIGILSSIVAVSLRGASDRAKNTKIVTSVVQVRTIAEVMYVQEVSGYQNLCSANTLNINNESLLILKNDIEHHGGAITCHASTRSYCLSVVLIGDTPRWFCIDDEGNNEEISAGNPCLNAESLCQ